MNNLNMTVKTFENLNEFEAWACSYCKHFSDYKKKSICERGHEMGYKNCGERHAKAFHI